MSFHIAPADTGFDFMCGDRPIIVHRDTAPAFTIGIGRSDIKMDRGNFDISDVVAEKLTLDCCQYDAENSSVNLWQSQYPDIILTIVQRNDALSFTCSDHRYNRLWINIMLDEGEHIWGGGEQMSYLALNGRRFPFWTSEPGVGRDKNTEITQIMDQSGHAGGDYWTTNYPQPTWLSSKRYAGHLAADCYSAFDLTLAGSLQIECWTTHTSLEFFTGDSMALLVGRLSEHFGRQPQLPDWAITGAIVGLKAGDESFARLENIAASRAAISGLWCEDWVGIRQTSFGKRLFWDWQWNKARYTDLPARIAQLREQGIRFLGYVNPYLAVDGALYREAAEKGLLALRQDRDAIYAVDFGEFDAAVVDFTNPAACDWFADRIIGQEMLDFGLSGWMADFGEYLPIDVRLFDGSDPTRAHNRWPVLWAKVNAQAISQRGKTGKAVFFMRAGFSGVQRYCPLLWAGDQCVDFSRHDGIGTVITAALSSGIVGNAYSHSDLGGYTSLHGMVRTQELLHRWIDLCAFTPVMRSHEGNRPDDNLQIDSNPELLAHFAEMSHVHAALAPYVRHLCAEAETTGLPLQRPVFLHYEANEFMQIQDQYLYGRDMMVAPVIEAGVDARDVILPDDRWVHLWSGQAYGGGRHKINAPNGKPPVFYRAASQYAPLFGTFAP